ncbi:hypothetical protein OTK51_01265 [Vibrio scophthalmi]|uniref:hypothetical protein n=1 Tax=Vibrio TaxID=662 RepID=UPI00021C0474|nr:MULTISPECIES: hypothetical protein [Vibrio]EGU29424.1 hypothetical protein VIBRN418_14411 [Vibrio sp. N418]MCY9802060.1 hypothetical protein [Vibrio scophthalmi]
MKKAFLIAAVSAALSFPTALFAAEPVEFQQIPQIMSQFETAPLYVKKAPTLGRLPKQQELGQDFPTYVADGKGGYTLETNNVMTKDVIVASMHTPIVGDVYNQWLIPTNVWVETYGSLPTSTEFQSFKRITTIKAIKIDEQMLDLLGSTDGETAVIKVSWDDKGMKVYKDGYLADYEYGIAPKEMHENYELAK